MNECPDVESHGCAAVLHSRVPQRFRVLHVAIRKGGPEALIQLHLALNDWGFSTTLDTRRSKKEKGGDVDPFFKTSYRKEFAGAPPLRWAPNYVEWHKSAAEGDVMVATETWPCNNDAAAFLPKGARQMQWHLTVWPSRDRSGCTIVGHTHYVSQYMKAPQVAVLFPYVSPHIIALATNNYTDLDGLKWSAQKRDLVLYDSDTKLRDSDLQSRQGVRHATQIATGFTPQKLYELYGQAKAGIDLRLPGGERFIYEAVLFRVCVIVDDALNGGTAEDFPLPREFVVRSGDLEQLNSVKDTCVKDYAAQIGKFQPLREHVLLQRTHFYRHVRRYFSNSVHIVTAACNTQDASLLAEFVAANLMYVPFATIEIALAEGVEPPSALWSALKKHSYLAAVTVTRLSSSASSSCETSLSILSSGRVVPTVNERRSLYLLMLPVNTTVTSYDFVHHFGSIVAFHEQKSKSDDGGNGVGSIHTLVAWSGGLFAAVRSSMLECLQSTGTESAVNSGKNGLDLATTCARRSKAVGAATGDTFEVLSVEDEIRDGYLSTQAEAGWTDPRIWNIVKDLNRSAQTHGGSDGGLVRLHWVEGIASRSESTRANLCAHALYKELFHGRC